MSTNGVQDISFYSEGELVAGHWYPATVEVPAPCVVLCGGFCQTKEMLMPDVATALAAAGYHSLAFDYRFIGASGGEPRTRIVPPEQVRDIRAALTWALDNDPVAGANIASSLTLT